MQPRGGLRRLRAIPLALRLLLLVTAIEVVAWAVALPALQGPDESAHYAYVQYLAETGKRPQFASGNGSDSPETLAAVSDFDLFATRGVAEARPFWSPADVALWNKTKRGLTDENRKAVSGPNAVAKNPPLYYAYEAIVYKLASGLSFLDRLFVMRLANGLLLLVTVSMTWLLAAELFRARYLRVLATGAVALQPMLTQMAGTVNPDTALTMFTAMFTVAAVRLVLRGFSARRVVAVFGFAAAAVATHGRGAPLVPIAFLALGLAWWRYRPRVRWRGVAAGAAAFAAVIAAAAYKLVLAPGGAAYGGEISIPQFHLGQFISFVWQFYFPRLPGMSPRIGPPYGFREVFIERYFGSFGNLEVTFSPNVIRLLQLACVFGVIALAIALVTRWRDWRNRWDVFALLASLVFVAVLFLHLVSYRGLVGGAGDPIIVGRYLLPLTPIAGLAVAFVAHASGRRAAPYLAAVVLAVSLLLQLGGLGLTFARFYA